MLNVGQGFEQRGAASFALRITPTDMRGVKEGRCSRVETLVEHAKKDDMLEHVDVRQEQEKMCECHICF